MAHTWLVRGAVFTLGFALLQGCGFGATDGSEGSENAEQQELNKRRRPPQTKDAGTPVVDAGTSKPDAGSSTSGAQFSCYTQGAPGNTCQSPEHCCFDNYSSQHNGSCTLTPRSCYGDMTCDGPEDCPSGGSCCAVGIKDPSGEFVVPIGYRIACQATACEVAPTNRELCHPGSTPAGTCSNPNAKCVSAKPNYASFPQTLYICQL